MIRKKAQKYSGKIIVDLTGPDGNAFVLLGMAKRWADELGFDWESIKTEATSSNYENLLQTLDKYFGEFVIFEE